MPKFEPSCLYSKQFGLRLLERALKGVTGVRAIPFRVYRSSGDYRESHFPPNTPRFLVRIDVETSKELANRTKTRDVPVIAWFEIPRLATEDEPRTPEELRRALHSLQDFRTP